MRYSTLMKAKKSLGQHFLTSEKALAQIVEAGAISTTDTVVEIGPGTGVLTAYLTARAGMVIAIEKDRDLIPVLQEQYADEIEEGSFKLIEGDILSLDLGILPQGYKLIANIPYYITGAIIERFLSANNQPERMVLLIQKEVADRIVARDKKESVLSIAVKAYGTPKIIAKVPAGAFNPPPKVDSAIIAIEGISKRFFSDINEQQFFALLKFIFGKKRGQLGGRLGEYIQDKERARTILTTLGIDVKIRAEDLSLSQWHDLARELLY